jgi:hypothetical protein
MLRILALAAAAASAHAFVVPSAARVQGSARGSSASRPALRGARALRAVYEPALRIGHGFDIHRLGESVHTRVQAVPLSPLSVLVVFDSCSTGRCVHFNVNELIMSQSKSHIIKHSSSLDSVLTLFLLSQSSPCSYLP